LPFTVVWACTEIEAPTHNTLNRNVESSVGHRQLFA
jgi:hypothetical protein